MRLHARVPSVFAVVLALAVAAGSTAGCKSRTHNEVGHSGQKSLESEVRRNKRGERVVDRFYLANIHSTQRIGDGEETVGDALIYGVACFDESAEPGATANVPNGPFRSSTDHIVFKSVPLKERTYVHEFSPFFSEFKGKPKEEIEAKKLTRKEPKRIRPENGGGCKVIFGSEKLAWEGRDADIDQDLLEKQLFEKVSSTAGTCTNFGANTLAVIGLSVTGAATLLPGFVPSVLTASSVLGVYSGFLGCKPAVTAFLRENAKFKQQMSEAIFNEAWNEATKNALSNLGASPKKARYDAALEKKDYLLASAIFNPFFVRAYNAEFNAKLERRGGWFNIVKTLDADEFFGYVEHLEYEVGMEYSKAFSKEGGGG